MRAKPLKLGEIACMCNAESVTSPSSSEHSLPEFIGIMYITPAFEEVPRSGDPSGMRVQACRAARFVQRIGLVQAPHLYGKVPSKSQ